MSPRTDRQIRGAPWRSVRAILLAVWGCTCATGAEPRIDSLSVRGLQSGGTTLISIAGSDLLPEPRLLAPFPIERQSVRDGARSDRLEFDVTLSADVAPGIYGLRLATADGISTGVAMGVDRLPQITIAESLPCLPVAVSGSVAGDQVVELTFAGTAEQRVVVDVEARRLGGKLNPVVSLLDAAGVQLAWSDGIDAIHGDARLQISLPGDGTYRIRLHDAVYRGAEPGFFRLKVGDLHYADLAFPLGVQRGRPTPVELVGGQAPDGSLGEVVNTSNGSRQALDLSSAVDEYQSVLTTFTGAAPALLVSDIEEIVECRQPEGELQSAAAPVAFNGRLSAADEEDRYRVRVQPGEKLRFDAWAARAGSPLDGVLSIYDEQGKKLAGNDDQPGTADPGLEFEVPKETQSVIVSVQDLLGRGGPEFVYRLAVTETGRPDFSLTAFTDRAAAPADGAAVIRVRAERAGYDGPIRLSFPLIPSDWTLSGAEIPAGATDALVTVMAASTAPTFALTSIVGTGTSGENQITRTAKLPPVPAAEYQPWFAEQLALGVIRSPGFDVQWDEWSRDDGLPLAAALESRIRVQRRDGLSGAVRLRLLTSQIVPKKEVDKKQVDDLDRALRLAGEAMIGAEQSEASARLLIPGDLPDIPYDVAVVAELLSEDGKQVLASATTPAVRLTTVEPSVELVLEGDSNLEVKTGVAPTARLIGRLRREVGFDEPVTVTLSGLPAELSAPAVEVPGDAETFELPLVFPFTSPPGKLDGVRLVGSSQLSADRKISLANSVPLELTIVAGGPPPGLFPVFEDEPTFATALNQGDGQGRLETGDRYSGTAAYHVTPGQRYREELPGLGVRIAEHPGDGEYRYLRFAWKKRGGENILLQLRAESGWGPSAGGEGPALRYEAGPGGNPYQAAAVKIDDALPEQWTVVTRDLFADFGSFQLDGLALTAGDGDEALFDHVYLARSESDLERCLAPVSHAPRLTIFEDDPEFAAALNEGSGQASVVTEDQYSGTGSIQVTPGQRFRTALPGLAVKIREHPAPGEYRYLRFAWKKQGGEIICLQINHDGQWGPTEGHSGKFRYDAGPRSEESYGAAIRIDRTLPADWTVVTRDLFADFGEFTFTGLALSPQDGQFARFDHIYLARGEADFNEAAP